MHRFVAPAALSALVALVVVCPFAAMATAQTSSWTAQDIGGPALSGSATLVSESASGSFTIDAAGGDISGPSDQFHFAHQTVRGDIEIVARIDALAPVNPWTIAGIMVRGSLAANAPHAFAGVTPGKGVYLRGRPSAGAGTAQVSGPAHSPPTWLRLVRKGPIVRGFTSRDGAAWTALGSVTVSLGETVYAGLAVTSRHPRNRTTAVASNVAIASIGLPPGLHSTDIGSPAMPGDVFASSGSYSITAAGTGIDGTADQAHFLYQPVTGNVEVIARVVSIDASTAAAKGGVTIRESLAAESRHATVVLSRGSGYAFQRRLDPAGNIALTHGGPGTAPGWVRLARTGDLFVAYRSANGRKWTKIGEDIVPLGETVYVGLAVTSQSVSAPDTAVIDSLSITGTANPGNRPPAVSILSPASGAQVTLPATVTLSAVASDPEDRMLSVDFYADWTLISRVTTAPYSVSWSPGAAGTYVLTAVAHDADGGSTTSSAAVVHAQPRPHTPPVVNLNTPGPTFTAPASIITTTAPAAATGQPAASTPPTVTLTTNGTSFVAPATITLAAAASDLDGQVARVEFLSGRTRVHTATTAPYSFAWRNVAAGTYSLTAVAFDHEGASATSAPVVLTVQKTASTPAPLSLIATRMDSAESATGSPADTVADSAGGLERAEPSSGTSRVAAVTASPNASVRSEVTAGVHGSAVLGADTEGAAGVSPPVTPIVQKAPGSAPVVNLTADDGGYTAPVTIKLAPGRARSGWSGHRQHNLGTRNRDGPGTAKPAACGDPDDQWDELHRAVTHRPRGDRGRSRWAGGARGILRGHHAAEHRHLGTLHIHVVPRASGQLRPDGRRARQGERQREISAGAGHRAPGAPGDYADDERHDVQRAGNDQTDR
jgi:hypothetical protein